MLNQRFWQNLNDRLPHHASSQYFVTFLWRWFTLFESDTSVDQKDWYKIYFVVVFELQGLRDEVDTLEEKLEKSGTGQSGAESDAKNIELQQQIKVSIFHEVDK